MRHRSRPGFSLQTMGNHFSEFNVTTAPKWSVENAWLLTEQRVMNLRLRSTDACQFVALSGP